MLRLVGLSSAFLFLSLMTACTRTETVTVEQTVIVERLVIVTATPKPFKFTERQVIGIAEGWPGTGVQNAGVSGAVFEFCARGARNIETDLKGPVFSAVPDSPGRWTVYAECTVSRAGVDPRTLVFGWLFFEDGPRMLPIIGNAADVTRQ
jgi:hypothetical protein